MTRTAFEVCRFISSQAPEQPDTEVFASATTQRGSASEIKRIADLIFVNCCYPEMSTRGDFTREPKQPRLSGERAEKAISADRRTESELAAAGKGQGMTIDYAKRYREFFRSLAGSPDAAAQAVGGQFEEFGYRMRDILVTAGLSDSQYLIDVGCGSGRLAHTLTMERYLGTDVVPELLEHARRLCPNPRWRFELVDGINIPEQSGVADMVCFFSVLTHLLHEDSFRYLCEAQRVLRPGGKVVFSFLEFRAESHWAVFESMVRARAEDRETHHNQFLDRDAIWSWARYAGFSLERFIDGESHPLGQSVCVLTAH